MASNILGSLIINLLTKADTTGLNKTDRAIQKTTKSVKTMNKEVGLIGKLSGKLMGGLNIDMVRNAFMGYLQFEQQLGSIHSRFYAITKDSQKANQQFEFARKIAKETAMDINNVVDSYSIFYSSAQRALGETGAQEVYSNWTKVSRVLHLSGAQYERVMYALREMSSKGQLYAQDLMIQMGTHVPDIRNVAETAIKRLNIEGVTSIKDFQEYTKKNAGTDAMPRFLTEFSREARRRFASDEALKKALQQPDALVQELKNVGFDIMYAFSKSGGSYMMIKILQGVANFISTIPFEQITSFLGRVAHIVGDIFQYIPQIMWTLSAILRIIAMYEIAKFIGGIGKLINIFKGFKGNVGFITKLLYSAGLAFPKIELLTSFLLRGGFKGLLKATLTGALGLTGPLGWLVSSLLWLPEIFKFVRWISEKVGIKNKDVDATQQLSELTGYDINSIVKSLKYITDNNITNALEMRKALESMGTSKLSPYIGLDEKHTVNVFIDNEKIGNASDIVKTQVDSKVNPKKNTNYSAKPKSPDVK